MQLVNLKLIYSYLKLKLLPRLHLLKLEPKGETPCLMVDQLINFFVSAFSQHQSECPGDWLYQQLSFDLLLRGQHLGEYLLG